MTTSSRCPGLFVLPDNRQCVSLRDCANQLNSSPGDPPHLRDSQPPLSDFLENTRLVQSQFLSQIDHRHQRDFHRQSPIQFFYYVTPGHVMQGVVRPRIPGKIVQCCFTDVAHPLISNTIDVCNSFDSVTSCHVETRGWFRCQTNQHLPKRWSNGLSFCSLKLLDWKRLR